MDTSHHPHTATSKPVRPNAGASRWLIVAVALCGALAGGSIVEAIAAMASRAPTPVSPDHLIAEPLAIAGALCGGLLAAILASKDQRRTTVVLILQLVHSYQSRQSRLSPASR